MEIYTVWDMAGRGQFLMQHFAWTAVAQSV
jgi:hypothetical protein